MQCVVTRSSAMDRNGTACLVAEMRTILYQTATMGIFLQELNRIFQDNYGRDMYMDGYSVDDL